MTNNMMLLLMMISDNENWQ